MGLSFSNTNFHKSMELKTKKTKKQKKNKKKEKKSVTRI